MNKFGAIKTTVDGIEFDSMREARRYGELKMLERAGEIRNLRLQVPVMLEGKNGPLKTRTGKAMRLTVDFVYEDKHLDWAEVYEDSKGKPTRDYEVRRAVAQAMGYEIKES